MGVFGKLKGAASLAKQIYDEGQSQSAQAQLAGSALQGPAGRHLVGLETGTEDAEDRGSRRVGARDARRAGGPRRRARALPRADPLAAAHQPLRDARRDAGAGRRPAPRRVRAGRAARARLRRLPRPRPHPPLGRRREAARRRVGHRARSDRGAPGRRPPRRRRLRRPRDLGRAPDRRAATARRGPRAGLSRAGRPRAGAHPRHRPPHHHRPVPGGHGGLPDRRGLRRPRLPPRPCRRRRRAARGRAAGGRPHRAPELGRDRRRGALRSASTARCCPRRSPTCR